MNKEKFANILQTEEEIIWVEGVNKFSFFINRYLKRFFASIFISFILGIFIGGPAVGIASDMYTGNMQTRMFKTIGLVFIIIVVFLLIVAFIRTIFEASNMGFAITNKRIIKRSGVFNIRYVHYSLKNIGTITVNGGLFDSRGENGSATIIITVKDFHTNTDGNTVPLRVVIPALRKAYKAYTLLSEKTEGNNESLRVDINK